ncbi:AbrB/MazE/SpoVT family DNA-binding domain-containing protein [Candidatus Pacebacteria bacterium]|nr:AbrB/MazE/SpoVT family DNA-binding domain-containing protein [Candidatus Paceibacterota bacterium]
MKTKIQKWGNSLGVRLPKNIAEQKSLKEGLRVSVVLKNNQIVIEPVEDEITLESMLSDVSTDNIHNETDWAKARGNEVW